MSSTRNRAAVTTSWDDGHPLDLRVAELLARRGMRGTFYVPLEYAACPRVSAAEIRQLRSMHMEIGSHTVTHPRLTRVSDDVALQEFRESKDGLEQILGEEVRTFCFPEGKFAKRFEPLLRMAGYRRARTTVGFRTESEFQPYAMPVTFQMWPHSRQILARHALKEGNLRGLSNWARLWGGETDLVRLADRAIQHIEQCGGTLHIWGHSWEIEQAGLWPALEQVLSRVSQRQDVEYVTNDHA